MNVSYKAASTYALIVMVSGSACSQRSTSQSFQGRAVDKSVEDNVQYCHGDIGTDADDIRIAAELWSAFATDCAASQDCAKDVLVTGTLVDADPNASWWQRIPGFAASYLQHTPQCTTATGSTVNCYDDSGEKPNPQALLDHDTHYDFSTPGPDENDADAVVVLTPVGQSNTTFSFTEIHADQPIRVSLQGKRRLTLNHPGVAVRTWSLTASGTRFRRCVDVGADGAPVHLAQRREAWNVEHFATISLDPCDDTDGSFADVEFVYEDGERHFVNPCYKTLDGTFDCSITPALVDEIANDHYTRRGKRIAVISKVVKAVAEAVVAVFAWEFGIGFFGLSELFGSTIAQAGMAAVAVKGVVGAIHQLSVCHHETGGDCFDEKTDLSVNLVINTLSVVAAGSTNLQETGATARKNLFGMLRGVWQEGNAKQAVSGLLSSYPWVTQRGDAAVEDLASAILQNPGGISDETYDLLENASSDADLNAAAGAIRTHSDPGEPWANTEPTAIDEHTPPDDHANDSNNEEYEDVAGESGSSNDEIVADFCTL